MSTQRGFTLIELLVTIAISAILASLATPMFDRLMAALNSDMTTENIQSTFAYARSEAMKRGSTVSVVPKGGNWSNGWTVALDGDSRFPDCVVSTALDADGMPLERVIRDYRIVSDKTTVVFATPGTCSPVATQPQCFAFDRRGTPITKTAGTPMTATICVRNSSDSSLSRRISLLSSGQILLEKVN